MHTILLQYGRKTGMVKMILSIGPIPGRKEGEKK
jgi:hypothetical protein